jgi:3-isopropylmalate dehydratase
MAAAAAMTGKLTDVRKFTSGAATAYASKTEPMKVRDAREFLTDPVLPSPAPAGYIGSADSLPTAKTPSSANKFTILRGITAPLAIENVDTDMIIPKQFLKTIKRTGLKDALFHTLRKDPVTGADTDFVLNRQPYDKAKILVCTGANFGCGSSREHAPWSL